MVPVKNLNQCAKLTDLLYTEDLPVLPAATAGPAAAGEIRHVPPAIQPGTNYTYLYTRSWSSLFATETVSLCIATRVAEADFQDPGMAKIGAKL